MKFDERFHILETKMENHNSDSLKTKTIEDWYEILEDEIPSVAEYLTTFWPQTLNVYNFITENLRLSHESGSTKTQLFQNNQSGALIAVTKGAYRKAAVFSPNKNYLGIELAFKDDKIMNWCDGLIVLSGIPLDLFEYLKTATPSIGKKLIYRNEIFDCYWMSPDVAKTLNVKCPDDMYFSKLEDCHTEVVNSTWRYGSNKTKVMVSDIINFMDTIGLFTKKDSKLVSWVLQTNYGIGMLYTVDVHRSKGYGTLVLRKLANILGQAGKTPILVTLQDNLAAKSVFLKSGFEFIEPLRYVGMEQDI
ncbi:hypothetical protein J437_LFUL004330 [Ladona fulva]|uniref:N-acetyltransferase domain-containing protein n=1 Tax=Ladona fulva TaxID=123851 RepID=A0A8K0K4I6_LADFU|nr:hypothetical protein J437_LFUL004330 [Ladona fulva]